MEWKRGKQFSDDLQTIGDALIAGVNQCRAGQPHDGVENRMEAARHRIPHCQYADKERAVALAERPVIIPSTAFNAMRTNSHTGNSENKAGTCAPSDSSSPTATDTAQAASVT